MPRPVSGGPHVQWVSPTVWTTLTLTIGADGTVAGEMTGASRFPRHWIYDHTGRLTAKSAVANLSEWMHVSHGAHTPWGAEDTRPLVAVVETALEHQLSVLIMHGGGPGAVIGERATLEGGRRTATVRAVTPCLVAVAARHQIDTGSLARLAEYHHREDALADG